MGDKAILAINFGIKEAGKAATLGGYAESTSATTFSETIGVVISIVLSLVGVIFLALMIYAGYLWMTARGDEEAIKKAQKIIIASMIGLIITVGAYSITNFVVPNLLKKATTDVNLQQ